MRPVQLTGRLFPVSMQKSGHLENSPIFMIKIRRATESAHSDAG